MQSLPAGGRYVKEDLVQQCLSDSARVEGLIEELENMDGNVGAVSQAITEVSHGSTREFLPSTDPARSLDAYAAQRKPCH